MPSKLKKPRKEKEVFEVECPHCGFEQIIEDGEGEYECVNEDCGEDFIIGDDTSCDNDSFEVECPYCRFEQTIEDGDGEYECVKCGEDFIIGDYTPSLKDAIEVATTIGTIVSLFSGSKK
jgi:DNA-directed RNA polymerase subunit RPC12/RpoP